jgi:hypothetical protein
MESQPGLTPVSVFVTIHECFEVRRDIDPLSIATIADFVGDIFRYVSSPFLCRIEGKDIDWIAILALKHASDDCFEVGFVFTRFEATKTPETIQNEINGLRPATRHDRWGPITHYATPYAIAEG